MDTATVIVLSAAATAASLLVADLLAAVPRLLPRLPRLHRSRAVRGTAVAVAALAALGRAPARAATPPPMLRIERPLEPAAAPPLAAVGSSATRFAAGPVAQHRVVPGDTLWGVAARELRERGGEAPASSEVDRYWRRIYDANRGLVGPDPDLIFPGQMLTIPSPGA